MPENQLYTQKCIRQIFKCSMHVSNRRVIYKGDVNQKLMPRNIPTLDRKPLTSQLMSLRPYFVRPRVPSQSDCVIRHMVRYNTEAYANI